MSCLKKNIAANLLGRAWTAVFGIVFIPIYLKLLGIEAYGLIGFFTTLQSIFFLVDLGLSTTLNRELARSTSEGSSAGNPGDLVRTLEVIYWLLALLIALALFALAPYIARYWINPQHLSRSTVENAIRLMGLAMGLQFPFALYQGGLLGLQRQVQLNAILVAAATVRGVGAVLVLTLVSPTIVAFLLWQAFVSLVQTIITTAALWGAMPPATEQPAFRRGILQGIWHFAMGITGISALGIVLTQLDKVILSKMLSLETFGYYSLATTVANSLYMIIAPIYTAVFPRLSQLASQEETASLAALYHRMCQLLSILLLPVTLLIVLFAPDLLFLWTHNPDTVRHTWLLVTVLSLGTALHGLMFLPYALQLAYGWTKLALHTNIIMVILLAPLIIWMTHHYGALGASVVWLVLNAGYVLITIQIMHRRLLPGEQWRWYSQDVGLPLAAALAVSLLGRWLIPASLPLFASLAAISGVLLISMGCAAASARPIRLWIWTSLSKYHLPANALRQE